MGYPDQFKANGPFAGGIPLEKILPLEKNLFTREGMVGLDLVPVAKVITMALR